MTDDHPSDVRIASADPDSDAVRACFLRYFRELDDVLAVGFDPAKSTSADGDELRPPRGIALIVWDGAAPVGCGAVKFGGETAEIKRMWLDPAVRGRGLSRRLLTALETHARESGARSVLLDTNDALTSAVGLYRGAGYVAVAPYNDNAYATHWFSKTL
ncbi:GNAT family N-acetyltransferase [Rhodococcus rhodnii]|uniref:N-acetyltransferase domain-containing protein n=2 Tax=Rhodococcus rhodnii TaxID=38312 RepID=R7WJ51_9NOCA|nr:GNAT family N-acetyltransferase [Rhodococcus rhodnii]EOM75268.1 hypothetical protein Rrhod_3403 [Rhodococcus rhodnii LMG 5362]TXG92095.1 GNAT family N-acetyltransferase [Rhodococcus rhodnii]